MRRSQEKVHAATLPDPEKACNPTERPTAPEGAGGDFRELTEEPPLRRWFIDGMSKNQKTPATTTSNTEKDPSEWTTGDEPMTGAQKSYLKTLSDEAKEPFDEKLTKAEASRRIDELQKKTGRGAPKG